MQTNAASASSSFATGSVSGATRNYFGAAVDIDVDGFKIPQLPLAGPSCQPITNNHITKNADSSHSPKAVQHTEVFRIAEHDRFPSPEGSNADEEAAALISPTFHLQPPPRVARSVAPSPAPSTVPQIHDDIERLYGLEAEQAEEIRALAKDVLAKAFQICLSAPGDLASRYRTQITELLGEAVGERIAEDAEELKETGRLPVRQPAWDFGYLEPRPNHAPTNFSTPTRSSMPPPSFIPSRKRLREEDSLEDVLEVENSLSLSRNPSIATISSSSASPATKRPRLESYEPTIDENEDDAMLGLIWGRYFQSATEENDDDEYSPSDEEMDDDTCDSSSDMEAEEEDFSIFALTRGLPDDIVGFIEEAALQEADRLAEEGAAAVPPSSPPAASASFPIHSFGTAEERPPVPEPRPIPPAPRRLQRSNERVTINEDGEVTAFDYTQTEEYAERMAWERHLFVTHGGSAFDNRRGPCDLAADLREITQVGPSGKLLNCHRWQYRFDEQAWRYFEVS